MAALNIRGSANLLREPFSVGRAYEIEPLSLQLLALLLVVADVALAAS
jgi:hypothetical protein